MCLLDFKIPCRDKRRWSRTTKRSMQVFTVKIVNTNSVCLGTTLACLFFRGKRALCDYIVGTFCVMSPLKISWRGKHGPRHLLVRIETSPRCDTWGEDNYYFFRELPIARQILGWWAEAAYCHHASVVVVDWKSWRCRTLLCVGTRIIVGQRQSAWHRFLCRTEPQRSRPTPVGE